MTIDHSQEAKAVRHNKKHGNSWQTVSNIIQFCEQPVEQYC
jgi:hypothetical protein